MDWTDYLEKVDWEIKYGEGEYDDYPDHVDYYYKGEKVWEDDFNDPSDLQIYNCMLDSFKSDMFKLGGKYHSEWVAEGE